MNPILYNVTERNRYASPGGLAGIYKNQKHISGGIHEQTKNT